METEIRVSPPLACSPDLTPSDYHIFRLLKDALCGCQFANNEEVKEEECGFMCYQKHSSQMASRSPWTEVANVWRN
jgi:hypothetical protein